MSIAFALRLHEFSPSKFGLLYSVGFSNKASVETFLFSQCYLEKAH